MKIRIMTLGMIAGCPYMIMDVNHHREDGTCLCPPGADEPDQAEV